MGNKQAYFKASELANYRVSIACKSLNTEKSRLADQCVQKLSNSLFG